MNPQNNNNQNDRVGERISLLLLTHNESSNLDRWTWLTKVKNINEIIVIDDNSTDDTIKIIKKLQSPLLSVKIKSRGLDQDFSAQRQFGINQAKNNWILWLDADEIPAPSMIRFIKNFDFNPLFVYAFKRHDIFLGHRLYHGETANQYFVRLFNRNQGKFLHPVHEIWQSDLPVQYCQEGIIHYSHQSLKSFLEKINFYTDIRARELFTQKTKASLFDIIFYPLAKFIQNYIFRLGLLDSTPGIIMSLGMSFHSFLVRAKLWHLYHS